MDQPLTTRVLLGRQVRFNVPVNFDPATPDSVPFNNHAGFPRPDGLAPHYQVTVELAGQPDPRTSCLADIKLIDRTIRELMIRSIRASVAESRDWPGDWLSRAWPAVRDALCRSVTPDARAVELVSLILDWTPFHHVSCHGEGQMVCLTEQFEFSAAHRLWSEKLSDEENHLAFGKCANPAGHGHNYVLDVTIAADGPADIGRLERIVHDAVIVPYDHRNLNVDSPDFASTNPTVENICRAIFRRLDETELANSLRRVRLYETPKTYAECCR